MEIPIAAFCDFASDNNGKLIFGGAFDAIYSSQFPATHPSCSAVFRVRFYRTDPTQIHFRFLLLDPGNSNILPEVVGNLTTQFRDGTDFIEKNLIFNLERLIFPDQGKFTAILQINEAPVASIPLNLLVKPAALGPALSPTPRWRQKLGTWLLK